MLARLSLIASATLVAVPAVAGSLELPSVAPGPVGRAADIASAASDPAAPADWTGFYAGGQLGWGNLRRDAFEGEFASALWGIHAGYQYDFGRVILSGELDWDAGNIQVNLVDVDAILRAKLRLGYDAGRFQPYLTAGWAKSHMSSDDLAADSVVDGGDEGTFGGIGVAYAVTDRFFVSGEILKHRFKDSLINQIGNGPFETVNLEVTTVSLRASMRF